MRKKSSSLHGIVLVIGVILVIVLGIYMIRKYTPSKDKADLQEYYQLQETEDTAIILDCVRQESLAKLVAGKIYVDFDYLHDTLNARFYWDEAENLLLYALPDKLITVEAGNSSYMIGKKVQNENYTIVYADADKAYVALDFVVQYTDIVYKMYENPNRIVITSQWGDVEVAKVKKDTEIRYRGGIKSPILRDVMEDEYVRVLDTEGKKWTKVCTSDGYIGYIKKRRLKKAETQTLVSEYKEPEYTHNLKNEKINMAWHQMGSTASSEKLAEVLAGTKGVNVISPTFFYLNDNEGNIASLASSDYVNYAHMQGVEVWALVSNLEKDVDTTKVLSLTSSRQRLVNNLISAAIQYNLDGINIDMEALAPAAGEGYIQFIRELSIKCKMNDVILSVDNYVPTAYTAFYKRGEQALFADYVIIMGYDEHYAGSEEAGSVASIGFVEQGIKDTKEEVPAEQIILGMPFYTRLWTEQKDEDGNLKVTSKIVRMTGQQNIVNKSGKKAKWLESCGQYYLSYKDADGTHKMWLEEEKSIALKMEAAKKEGIAGTAVWKLGMEKPSIWNTIVKYGN